MGNWVLKANLKGPRGFQGPQGLPGVNATPADIAVAGYMATLGTSATKTALRNVITEATSVVSAARFGADSTGVADATAAIQAALDACPEGGTVLIPMGTYRLDGTLIDSGKTVSVSAYGANFVKPNATPAVQFAGAWETTIAVTAAVAGSMTEGGATTDILTLTVGTAPTWVRGDLVKVWADDIIPGSQWDIPVPAASSGRVGQFFTVVSVSTGTIVLRGKLRDAMTTGIKVARLPNQTVVWDGGTFSFDPSVTTSSMMFRFSAMQSPTVRDVTIRGARGQAFSMVSNFGYLVENCRVDWAWDDTGSDAYGYGVDDNTSEFGRVSGCRFNQPRHGYTATASGTTVGQDSPSIHGRTYGTKVTDMVVTSASATAFDVHSNGQQITFENCLAINSPVGFSMRGNRNRIVNCEARDCRGGIRMASDSDYGDSWGHTVDGFETDGTSVYVITAITRHGGAHPLYGVRDTRTTTIRNVHARKATGQGLVFMNTTIDADNVYIEYEGAVVDGDGINTCSNTGFVAGRVRFSTVGMTGTGARLFGVAGSNPFEIESLRVTGFSGMATNLKVLVDVSADSPEVRVNALTDYLPSLGFVSQNLTANSWVRGTVATDVNNPSTVRAVLTDATSSADLIQNIARRRDPVIVVDFVLASGQTLASLPNHGVQGTVLLITNGSTSSGNLTIGNGAGTSLNGGTSKTLTPGQSIQLVYVGAWRQLNLI